MNPRMLDIILLLVSLIGLISIKNWIHRRLQAVVMLLGGSKRLSLKIYSLIFLPGVIIHELSHFFMASILNVRTGKINIFPSDHQEDGRVALGSVQVAKTDFIRSSLVGMAPFIFGCILLYSLTVILFGPLLAQPTLHQAIIWLTDQSEIITSPLTWLWLYLIIAIANTMFMSKEDTRSLPFLGLVFLLLLTAVFISGRALDVGIFVWPFIQSIARALGTTFAITLGINFTGLVVLYGIQIGIQKLTRKRVVFN